MVGLAGVKAAGITNADWNGNEFPRHFTRGQALGARLHHHDAAHGRGHAFYIMKALGTEHALAPLFHLFRLSFRWSLMGSERGGEVRDALLAAHPVAPRYDGQGRAGSQQQGCADADPE